MNIIVVDANDSFRNTISDILDTNFQVVATASTVDRVLELAAGIKPELVLIDIDLCGECNGFWVGKRILEQNPGIKILFMTTFYEEHYKVLSRQIGALKVITKNNLNVSVLNEILNQV